jgi:UDP-glucuronate 4-epimerase
MKARQPIPVFGDGSTRRDYTYVADIVAGLRSALDYTASAYEVINLGNNKTVSLREMIEGLEQALGVPANIEWLPEQPGDVPRTWANVDKARRLLGYEPRTPFAAGVKRFVESL